MEAIKKNKQSGAGFEPVYVTGHKNPDTDSIVSAMAYAALRNALGDRDYVAARIGHISDETKLVLDRFGFSPPVHIKTLRPQVKDLEYYTPPALSGGVTVSRGWDALKEDRSIPAIPVTNDDGTLLGMLSAADIATYDMASVNNPVIEDIPVFNLLSVLDGKIMNDSGYLCDSVSGEVIIALPQKSENLLFSNKKSIVICGDQPDMAKRAVELGVKCLIVCQASLPKELYSVTTETCIISTPFDAFKAARMIYHAIPVERICRQDELDPFKLTDYLDDVKDAAIRSQRRNFPILDENGLVVGAFARDHLLKPRRRRVVLVDHNEASQSIDGLEQADVLEIIDHHRLADIQTTSPISFRNEPVGSTATIIAEMYQERGLMPNEKLAGLIAAAIVSDTVMFKSPTATLIDQRMAERMARIAKVSLDDLGREIFSASMGGDKSVETLLFTDFKTFHIADRDFGVNQITCVEAKHMLERKEEFLDIMRKTAEKRGYAFMILMLTDILAEGSHILYIGDEDIIAHAFGADVDVRDHAFFLPGVVSRKKQVIPMLTALWG
ncbi:MAG: putative manganese-dependent inorganic diphosphatase [Oscillospiraceae bacterium]|nr:putative manganese-dependent inorganic diphosphatase [Oscillospiraceae bacterium]